MLQPKPIGRKYDDIIRNIENGTYQIPKFQRDFVWDRNRSAKLIESLLKGYPIGSFILWKTKDRLKSLKKLGGEILKDIQDGDFVYYILDGQQRITSLYLAIKGLTANNNNYKKIFIDLDKDMENDDDVCVCDAPKNAISFYDLMNKDILEINDEFGREIANKVKYLKKRIESYEFSTIEIEDQSLNKIADIFTRINTSGKELTLFEIMNAKIYTEATPNQEGFDLEEKFENLIKELERSGYESIAENKSIILQLMALVLIKNAKRETILSIDKDIFIEKWDLVVDCLKLAIDKIRDYLKIPVSKLLPYYALVIPFAYFYYINSKKPPTPIQLKKLSIYFFRAAFGERFSSSTESKLNEDIKLIEKIHKDEEIDFRREVECEESKEYYEEELTYGFSVSSAFDKAFLCILASNDPKKFNDNSSVRLDNSCLNIASSRNYHHFFPKAYLKKQNKYDEKIINCLANITLVDDYINKKVIKDKSPSIYIKEFKNNPDLEQTLKTHYIDLNDFGVLEDDYDKFLKNRASVLADEILKRIK